ncbi:MAG: hydrolase [Clostridia bacterium]|nr:hydrolase [Clostridia bacterium]
MEAKDEFLEIFYDNIEREGSEALLEWLQKSDFFDAPASTNNHSAFRGGLCLHSVNVYKRFLSLIKQEFGENFERIISKESIAIIALLHDVCKVDFYVTEMRNVKEDGVWVQKPYYKVEDSLPYGHGEKSVYIISAFMKLTREEAMAINWHMGGFDPRVRAGGYGMSEAFYKYPIAALFHISDFLATYMDEEKGGN